MKLQLQTPNISLLTTTSLSRNSHWIKNSLHRQHKFGTNTGTPSHVHAQPMLISIGDLVWLKQSCNTSTGWTGKELQERGEVLCADTLHGQRRVAQIMCMVRAIVGDHLSEEMHVLGRSCVVCAFGQAMHRTNPRASFGVLSIAHRCYVITSQSSRGIDAKGRDNE